MSRRRRAERHNTCAEQFLGVDLAIQSFQRIARRERMRRISSAFRVRTTRIREKRAKDTVYPAPAKSSRSRPGLSQKTVSVGRHFVLSFYKRHP